MTYAGTYFGMGLGKILVVIFFMLIGLMIALNRKIIPLTIITFGIMPKAIWPWVMFSLTSFCGTLGYAGLSVHFPINYAGRVSTAVNLITFLILHETHLTYFD